MCSTTSFSFNLSQTSKKNLANSSSEIGFPLIRIRSRTATRWGEVYSPNHEPQESVHETYDEICRTYFPLWPGMSQNRIRECARRALALGTSDVDNVKCVQVMRLKTMS